MKSNKLFIKRVLVLIIAICVLLLIFYKFYQNKSKNDINLSNVSLYTSKNFNSQDRNCAIGVNDKKGRVDSVSLVSYQNDIVNVDNIKKVYDFVLSLKGNKIFHYEFRRQIEKRNLIEIISDKEKFASILDNKEKFFDKNTIELIEKEFGNYDNFVDLFYYFYISLFFSQLEDRIPQLIKYKESLEDKLYKIKPETLEELKKKLETVSDLSEKQKIQELIDELSKNVYKDLSNEKRKVIEEKLGEVNELLRVYDEIKNEDYYKWVLENRDKILKEIRY